MSGHVGHCISLILEKASILMPIHKVDTKQFKEEMDRIEKDILGD